LGGGGGVVDPDPHQTERQDPDPHAHQSDPDPHQFADDNSKCIDYLSEQFFKVFEQFCSEILKKFDLDI
jgi:hypothetical protein